MLCSFHDLTADIFGDRRVLLHNIRFDEPVASFSNASGTGTNDEAFLGGMPRGNAAGGACTAISFRTGMSTLFSSPEAFLMIRLLCLSWSPMTLKNGTFQQTSDRLWVSVSS